MIDNIFVAVVLAFLIGVAVGIAGYFFTTIAAYEKEIEEIFQNMCNKYENKLKIKEEENDRLHETVVDLQVQLARRGIIKKRGESK
jgi:hypothetical protein